MASSNDAFENLTWLTFDLMVKRYTIEITLALNTHGLEILIEWAL